MALLTILPAARLDLIEIGDFIALDNPDRARSFIAEIQAIITDQIAARPASFPPRDDLDRVCDPPTTGAIASSFFSQARAFKS